MTFAAVAVPLAQPPARAAVAPTAATFRCDSADGVWQKLRMDDNHDNLTARITTSEARPGEAVTFDLVWEWRDWRPGATLTFRHCLDVDSTADGSATAPFDALGGNPADVTVVHPTEEPTTTVMKGPEVRPAVVMPFTVSIPADAPAGGGVCIRSAILPSEAEHQHSPPVYDISESFCFTVVAPRNVPPAPPAPAPPLAPPPEASSETVTGPTETPPATVPPAEVGGVRSLPRTGVSLPIALAFAGLLLLGGAVAAWRKPKPFLVMEPFQEGRRRRGS